MSSRIKITDLEEFVYEQIRRPYQSEVPNSTKIRLYNVVEYHARYPEWWLLVIDRIKRCNFYFPYYIKHPLIDLINFYIKGY